MSQSRTNPPPASAYTEGSRLVSPGPEVLLERLKYTVERMAERIETLEAKERRRKARNERAERTARWFVYLLALAALGMVAWLVITGGVA